jgi:hypothetical protein
MGIGTVYLLCPEILAEIAEVAEVAESNSDAEPST